VAALIAAAAAGRFPAVDGGWQRVPPWHPELEAVFAFTGHAIFAVRPDITVPAGQLTVAAAAPGNAASVRSLLAAGFTPLGSLQLFRRAGPPPTAAERRALRPR
jgi:hypothetical protein